MSEVCHAVSCCHLDTDPQISTSHTDRVELRMSSLNTYSTLSIHPFCMFNISFGKKIPSINRYNTTSTSTTYVCNHPTRGEAAPLQPRRSREASKGE